jgi:hypothetical protein
MKDDKKNKTKANNIIVEVISFLVFMAVGYYFADNIVRDMKTLDDVGGIVLNMFIVFICIYISIFLIINIHEFGHFLFGKMFKYKLYAYKIGFLTWKKENGKIRFSIEKNKGYSGYAGMLPPDKIPSKTKLILFYAGGIILNVITGFIALYFNVKYGINYLASFWILSFILAFFNLLPMKSAGNPLDGKLIWTLFLGKENAEVLMNINIISAQLTRGIRPKEVELLKTNIDKNLTSDEISLILYTYFYALDSQDYDNLEKYAKRLEEVLYNCPTILLPPLCYELCFYYCVNNNIDKSKEYYKKIEKQIEKDEDSNGCRVKAYYNYYIKNNLDKAKEYCEKGMLNIKKFPIRGQAKMEVELINTLKEKLFN